MEKQKINARIVADSIDPRGNRITTFVLTYPRIIHAEVMTHRLFSRNAASSRAIPFKKMVESVKNDPFIPIAWQRDHKGMQGTKYIVDPIEIKNCIKQWLFARDEAVNHSENLHGDYYIYDGTDIPLQMGVTKQLCNRLLEPFQWYTCLVTTTELENFYKLRCPQYWETELEEEYFKSKKDLLKKYPERINESDEYWYKVNKSQAEIHIQAIAEAMWDAQNESKPSLLGDGEWHIPFGDKFSTSELRKLEESLNTKDRTRLAISIATARCARLSYMTFDGEIDYTKDMALHNQLLESGHMSPFEHCARAMTDSEYHSFYKGEYPTGVEYEGDIYNMETYPKHYKHYKGQHGWCNNFRGFIQYRYLIEHGTSNK